MENKPKKPKLSKKLENVAPPIQPNKDIPQINVDLSERSAGDCVVDEKNASLMMQRKIEFEVWYRNKMCSEGLPGSMKEIILAHFSAFGFLANGHFDEGLIHFGWKP